MPSLKIISNPPNPFHTQSVEWLDVEPNLQVKVFEERVSSILSKNDSPDIPFTYSINPYRGCFHNCSYCYARPTHHYIDHGAGSDFANMLVVKVNAAQKLREAFLKPSWKGEWIAFSGITDCYQPLEAYYEITRECLLICSEFRNPVVIITKGALIRRDLDLLTELNKVAAVRVFISIPFCDEEMAKALEPSAPRPSTRFRVVRDLTEKGIPVGISLSPVIPGLSDSQIPIILKQAYDAGARSAFMTLLRLPGEVKDIFLEELSRHYPDHSTKVISYIKDMKAGSLNISRFGSRMEGSGPRWEAIEWLFESTCKKLGITARNDADYPSTSSFCRPTTQLSLLERI